LIPIEHCWSIAVLVWRNKDQNYRRRDWRQRSSKHIETLYVDRPQFTTLLLPLISTGVYPDGNSPWSQENRGKLNPEMGFKSPRAEMPVFKWLFLNNLCSENAWGDSESRPHRLMPRLNRTQGGEVVTRHVWFRH
jgi:hypothetical protein